MGVASAAPFSFTVQLFAGPPVECTEARIVSRADKDQPSGRRDGAAVSGTPSIALVFRQAVGYAKWYPPRDLTGIHIDCREFSPGRLLARKLLRAWSLDAESSPARNALVGTVGIDPVALPVRHRWTILRIVVPEARYLPQLVDVREQIAQRWIERGTSPIHAAVVARELHTEMVITDRQKRPSDFHALDELLAGRFEFGRDGCDIGLAECHSHKGRRLEGKRLRLRGALEWDFAGRYGALLNSINRFSGDAIQQKDHSDLIHGNYGGNGFTSLLYVNERWSAREISVPDIVMDHLEVPQILSCVGVGCHEAGAEEIIACAVTAILVYGRRAEGHVYDTALFVDRQEAPDIDACAIFPTVVSPGVMILFARLGNGMERPGQLSGSHVPGADVAGRAMRRIFLRSTTSDDKVLVHDGRG